MDWKNGDILTKNCPVMKQEKRNSKKIYPVLSGRLRNTAEMKRGLIKMVRKITKLKWNIYFEGEWKMRDVDSNYAYPFDFPIIFEAYWKAIYSGNWRSCTAINTPLSIIEMLNDAGKQNFQSCYDIKLKGLTDSENFEFWGLVYSLVSVAECYEVFRFGNHGTHEGLKIENKKIAKRIFEGSVIMVNRANELLSKIKGIQ